MRTFVLFFGRSGADEGDCAARTQIDASIAEHAMPQGARLAVFHLYIGDGTILYAFLAPDALRGVDLQMLALFRLAFPPIFALAKVSHGVGENAESALFRFSAQDPLCKSVHTLFGAGEGLFLLLGVFDRENLAVGKVVRHIEVLRTDHIPAEFLHRAPDACSAVARKEVLCLGNQNVFTAQKSAVSMYELPHGNGRGGAVDRKGEQYDVRLCQLSCKIVCGSDVKELRTIFLGKLFAKPVCNISRVSRSGKIECRKSFHNTFLYAGIPVLVPLLKFTKKTLRRAVNYATMGKI